MEKSAQPATAFLPLKVDRKGLDLFVVTVMHDKIPKKYYVLINGSLRWSLALLHTDTRRGGKAMRSARGEADEEGDVAVVTVWFAYPPIFSSAKKEVLILNSWVL